MSRELQLKIVSLKEVVHHDYVDSVTLPTVTGEITVLPKHAPLISHLTQGKIRTRFEGKDTTFDIAGGFMEVDADSRLTILLTT
ncbi:MAG: hypothetical protein COV91_02070 [Candidatus Taylorbacteria bacterium CG11_big_fil_rev_8_21_14_0_20_46_11]|uniref:ATP synthase F1 complex delta/epsilon subunit N-terminal domain-containing protein n=1 Tax=Candidatus Taylorbacteria bacterium CG11_big_fil_rev_8_21_14_0_20_46_11 TaxID=1975025 RepID=A0A2H0KC79_9BACT|nr:MAG: hypothetical protein COV91_02070 [Candidatus Taylorbacteria bacterium CG11_big_fil_rev_8_21_14_0_20_46_11]